MATAAPPEVSLNGFSGYWQFSDDQLFYINSESIFNIAPVTIQYEEEITYDYPTITPSLTGDFAANFNTRSSLIYSYSKTWFSFTTLAWFHPGGVDATIAPIIGALNDDGVWASGFYMYGAYHPNQPHWKIYGPTDPGPDTYSRRNKVCIL